jgi:hypothetical protein
VTIAVKVTDAPPTGPLGLNEKLAVGTEFAVTTRYEVSLILVTALLDTSCTVTLTVYVPGPL